MRNTLTILLGFAFAACAAQPPGGGGPSGDPGGDDNTPGGNPNDGDGDDPGGNPNGGGATAAAVLDRISKTECDQAHTCKASFPTDAGVTFAEIFGNTVDECYPLNAEYWNVDAVEAGIAAGKITFDQAAADACLSGAITAPACTAFWSEGPGIPDACWASFTGTVAQGGACAIDFECSGELFCGQAGTCTADGT